MKQIIQSLKTGETILEEVPAPKVKSGTVLIQTIKSLVSLCTELMSVEFRKTNLIEKALQQLEKVKMVLYKIKTYRLLSILKTLFNKLVKSLILVKAYSKERVELYSQERTLIMDNFRKTKGYGFKGFRGMSTKIAKGHKNQFHKLINQLKTGGEPLIPMEELVNTTLASFAAIESLKNNSWINLSKFKSP